MYNSNRDILPGVNACLYIIFHCWGKKEKKKGQSSHLWWFLSCQHFGVWRLWQGDKMPYLTLWISEDSWNRCVRGFGFTAVYCDLIMLLTLMLHRLLFGLWRCTGLTVVKKIWCQLICVILDQSLYHVAASHNVHRCFPLVWSGTILVIFLSHGQFDCVIVQCIIETIG